MYANDFSGTILKTTANSQVDGWDRVQDDLAGIKSKKVAAPTSTRTSARQKDRPVKSHAKPKRQSDKYVPGPGRGIRDRVKSVNDAKEGLQKNIDGVLSLGDDSFGAITPDAAAAMANLHQHIDAIGSTDMSHACREIIKHQQEQQKRSGKSKRSLRRVQKEIKDTISNYELEDKLHILEGVLSSLSKSHKKRKRQAEIKDLIVESLVIPLVIKQLKTLTPVTPLVIPLVIKQNHSPNHKKHCCNPLQLATTINGFALH